MASRRAPLVLLLVAALAAGACTAADQPRAGAPREEQRGDCGPGGTDPVPAARDLMDSQVPSGPAAFRGAADVCGIDEMEIAVGRARTPTRRTSATVYFAPTVLVGEPGQELTLVVTHDGGSKTHSFTVDELDIDELIFSSDRRGIGTRIRVEVELPADGEPLLFYCRFHRVGGMWGALTTRR